MDTTNDSEVAPPVIDVIESASPSSDKPEPKVEEPPAPPHNRFKPEALRRLKALERRGKTVGNHLDELRALLTVLFEQLPD